MLILLFIYQILCRVLCLRLSTNNVNILLPCSAREVLVYVSLRLLFYTLTHEECMHSNTDSLYNTFLTIFEGKLCIPFIAPDALLRLGSILILGKWRRRQQLPVKIISLMLITIRYCLMKINWYQTSSCCNHLEVFSSSECGPGANATEQNSFESYPKLIREKSVYDRVNCRITIAQPEQNGEQKGLNAVGTESPH